MPIKKITFNIDVSDKHFCFIEEDEVFQLIAFIRPATDDEKSSKTAALLHDENNAIWNWMWWGSEGNTISRNDSVHGYPSKKVAVLDALARCADDEFEGLRSDCEVFVFNTVAEQLEWMTMKVKEIEQSK